MKILSIGTPLARWLARGIDSRVIARFEMTVQFRARDGLIWAITTRDHPGAYRAVVDELDVGQISHLSFDQSALWDPRPRSRALNEYDRVIAAWTMVFALRDLPDALGFWDLLADEWETIRAGLHQRDVARLRAVLARLIGRGPGLTPTGDDFTQALLVTLRTGDAYDRAAFQSLARAIAPLLANTTRASQQFLREAISGYAFGALKDVLDELPNPSPDTMQKLFSIGASSGHAYALGVLMGLEKITTNLRIERIHF